ncbi:MORN3 protein, partial [Polypterus senegalus]|nr:MORN3 protein [Polypterus senegalus]
MPWLRKPREFQPLWKEWDRNAQKCGLRHTVYYISGDHYYFHSPLLFIKKGRGVEILKNPASRYKGFWKEGKRGNYGILSIPDPETGKYKEVYSGGWVNGLKEGIGKYNYSENEFYEGEWSRDQRSGWGRMYFRDGSIYEGEWLKDKQDGQGMHLLKNENYYEGYWKGGKKHGPGKFFYFDKGQVYEGIWVEDIPKCGTIRDFQRHVATDPPQYPVPQVYIRSLQLHQLYRQESITCRLL